MGRISKEDVLTFTRQLAAFVKMRFPLGESLSQIRDGFGRRQGIAEVIQKINEQVGRGDSLSKSLEPFREIFTPLYGKMVELGESSDMLEKALAQLTDYLEFNRKMVREVNAALSYPFAVFSFLMVEAIIIFSYAMPKFSALFGGMNLTLPLITKMVIAFNDIYSRYHLAWLFILLIIVANCWHLIPGLIGDRLRLNIPLLGVLFKRLSYAQFARSLSMVLSCGVPLDTAIEFSAKAVDNKCAAEEIRRALEYVKGGKSLSEALANVPYFSSTFTWMVAAGEKREQLAETLLDISDYFDKEARSSLFSVIRFIEPLAMIALGLFVALIVIAVFYPIYNVSSSLH
ncbi:MAG: type II secretion system F family protein [Candidatus Xenobiia bacterium LiM19]